MPPAARITDMHTCPMVNPGPVPHVGGPISSGCATVNIGYLPAARVSDTAICVPATDSISQGSPNVIIGYKNAARIGDPTVHGGVIVQGCPTVIIGSTTQSFVLTAAAASGAPFCEECEKAKKAAAEKALKKPPPENKPPAESATLAMATPASPTPAAPASPYTPTQAEIDLAAAPGNTSAQRAAREKVIRDFYERYKNDGLGQSRADQDMGVGGSPPRPNGKPTGYGIDLSKPVETIKFPPPQTMDQYVRIKPGYAGNFFDPIGGQSGDALGLNDDPKLRRSRTFDMPPGEGLVTGNGPIIDDWTDKDPVTGKVNNAVQTKGGGTQVTVPDSIRKGARCVCCGNQPCTK